MISSTNNCSYGNKATSANGLQAPSLNCGHPIAVPALASQPSQHRPAPERGETLGLLLVVAPLAAAALSWFWVSQLRLIDNPASKLGLLAISTILLTAIIAAIESARLGIGSDADLAAWNAGRTKPGTTAQRLDETGSAKICEYCGVENRHDAERCGRCGQSEFKESDEPKTISKTGMKPPSPITWLFGMALLWLFVYPTYLYYRSKYGAKNLVAGLFAMFLFLGTTGYVYVLIDDAHLNLKNQINHTQQELQRMFR